MKVAIGGENEGSMAIDDSGKLHKKQCVAIYGKDGCACTVHGDWCQG